jgi:ABC-type lipoprotein export system ATPase subunit
MAIQRLQLRNLTYQYKPEQTLRFPDLNLNAEENLLILGPSGSGKSTLLHLISVLIKPKSGTLLIDDQNPHLLSTKRADQFRAEHIGMVWQKSHFVNALSLKENLRLAQKLSTGKTDEGVMMDFCKQLGIDHLLSHKPNRVSIGEQQRFSIVRAALGKPKLLLADEPTSALDDTNAVKVAELLFSVAERSKASLIVVTHDARLKSMFKNQIQL